MDFGILTERETWLQDVLNGSPIVYDENMASWNIYRFADVKRVLSDPATFSSRAPATMQNPIAWR